MWINGMGKSGKSSVIRVLYQYLYDINPELAQNIEHINHEDKFSMASYKNCRLAIISDNANRWLLKRETIKNLTGHDVVSIREMNKQKVTRQIHCKIMVASNYPPYIFVDVEHEISRMMYIELEDKRCIEARRRWLRLLKVIGINC